MKNLAIENIKNYLYLREEIITAYLFGSYASNRGGPMSDIDIAVLLSSNVNSKDYSFLKLKIITDLIELLSFNNIDVVILNIAPPLLLHEVIKKGILLFSRNEKERLEFIVKSTMRYLDTIHLRKVQDRVLHEKIRSGDFGYFKGSNKYSIEKVRKGVTGTSTIK
jgi:predicted nucleotidyltransferase